MGYLHIENLYKNRAIQLFRECYALEKIHGTSAHLSWQADRGTVAFFAGGESHERFVTLFDESALREGFILLGHASVFVYGEAYGGRCQGMKKVYGEALRFVAFDVKVGESWLDVPNAEEVVHGLGIEFVHYEKGPTDDTWLNSQRDTPSVQARRNGIEGIQPREGVVLRPLIEVTTNSGARVISKHKSEAYKETVTHRSLGTDPVVLDAADAIANEWVTRMRLAHVLDKLKSEHGRELVIEDMRLVLDAMVEDVMREAKGEIVESAAAKRAICKRTAALFKSY